MRFTRRKKSKEPSLADLLDLIAAGYLFGRALGKIGNFDPLGIWSLTEAERRR